MSKQYRIYLDDFYLEELVVYKGSYRFVGELLVEYLWDNPDLQVPADLLDDDSFKKAFFKETDFTKSGPAILTLADNGLIHVTYGRAVLEATYDDPNVQSLYLLSVLDNYNHVQPHPMQIILKSHRSLDQSTTFLDKQRRIGELLVEYLKDESGVYTSADLEDGESYKKLFVDGTDFNQRGDVLLTLEDGEFTVNHIDFHNDFIELRTSNPDLRVTTFGDIKTILHRQALK